ncbi:MAG: ribosomal protein S18-alanine N-acetyltransferase [Acidobacteriota bacterium]
MDFRLWLRRREKKIEQPYVAAFAEAVVKEMTAADLNECWKLDQECFYDSEAYDRETLRYLLSHNKSSCYKVTLAANHMVAFIIGMIEPDNTGHIVALGVSPVHRRRGYAEQLMDAVENSFTHQGINAVRLEVRTSNQAAQRLYLKLGYKILRHMPKYYSSGDDGYLMIKNF